MQSLFKARQKGTLQIMSKTIHISDFSEIKVKATGKKQHFLLVGNINHIGTQTENNIN